MSQSFSLESVKTDGWFERIGEGIGSFQALCEIVGERFVAYSLITGARITALSVDRRNNDASLVDFVVGAADDDADVEPQRLSLGEFRRRLVAALLADEVQAGPPARETDVEAIQLHIGVRNLLLAPIYGYSLRTLEVGEDSVVHLSRDGVDESYELGSFRGRLRSHVREELERVTQSQQGGGRGTIDLAKVSDAEAAEARGDFARVKVLLGAWPAPLAIFIRTPDGQHLAPEARALIAKGLSLLATAAFRTSDADSGGEIFRLAVQYAQDGLIAGEVYRRMGEALLSVGRAGESIAALRRAVNLGAAADKVWPQLAKAFHERNKHVAAVVCLREARLAGATPEVTAPIEALLKTKLGSAYPA